MPRRERRVVEAELRQRARPEVLDEHVGLRDQPLEQRAVPPGCLKSSVTLSLLRLMLRKYALSPFEKRRAPGARVVAFAGLLDLDDARAHVGEQHRAVRARQHARQVEHGDPVEWRHNGQMIIVYAGSA